MWQEGASILLGFGTNDILKWDGILYLIVEYEYSIVVLLNTTDNSSFSIIITLFTGPHL